MIEKLVNWIIWIKHKLAGHMLVTVLAYNGENYTFYASSIYTDGGVLKIDDIESGIPVELKPERDNILVTGV